MVPVEGDRLHVDLDRVQEPLRRVGGSVPAERHLELDEHPQLIRGLHQLLLSTNTIVMTAIIVMEAIIAIFMNASSSEIINADLAWALTAGG